MSLSKPTQRTKSEQELFWHGEFGTAYTERNKGLAANRRPFFEHIRTLTGRVGSICELGANRGENLEALADVFPGCAMTGVEINPVACSQLRTIAGVTAIEGSIQDFETNESFDLVFTCGVLIHISPEDLSAVYSRMMQLSSRYLLVNEYYNPSPVEIPYRGHTGKLFKRDFAGELWDCVGRDKLRLMGKGFLWQRVDPAWDNTTWFLFEKNA